MQTSPLAATLASVTLGPEVVVGNLTMFPLLRAADAPVLLDYSVLDDALAAGASRSPKCPSRGVSPT